MMGHEYEFYLLDRQTLQPLFGGVHIFNTTRNTYIDAVEVILRNLQGIGLDLITHNCEYAPSQFEINYGPAIGIEAADKAFTFRNTVKEVAHLQGYLATFMSKPINGMAGCGCHFHISLLDRKTGKNVFFDPADKDGVSLPARQFAAGILAHAPALMALAGPTPNCYHRIKPHTFAPSNISWGIEDRSALVRVKATKDSGTHHEMRGASALANPYLTAAGTLAAGLLGLKGKLKLGPQSKGPSEDDPQHPKLAHQPGAIARRPRGGSGLRPDAGAGFPEALPHRQTLRARPLPQPYHGLGAQRVSRGVLIGRAAPRRGS